MKKVILILLTFILALYIGILPAAAEDQYYTVKSGDTLWVIARSKETTVNELMQINQLSSDKLSIGQKLKLNAVSVNTPAPIADAAEQTAAQSTVYYVQPGDSLWTIAVNHRTTVESIMDINQLEGSLLQPGAKLIINSNDLDNTVSRSGSSVNGRRVINYASNFLGTPYRYGGTSPKGFDCSGFVQYVYKQFNISLPRTAASQYQAGVKVDKSNLQSGDLVFFKCGGAGIDHVGIYTGENNFIHSSSPSSGGVINSSLRESYYASSYVGAKRILP